VLSGDQVDLWIIHRGGFIIDLLAGFTLTCQSTRLVAVLVVTAFHVMNSFIFPIGQSVRPSGATWRIRLIDAGCRSPYRSILLPICRPSGCTVVSGVVVVVVGDCNRSQMRTSKCTCLIFGVSIGLDPG